MSSSVKIEVYIDNERIECVDTPQIVVSYDAAITRSLDKAREGRSVELTVALSSSGESVFGVEGYLHANSRFNGEGHTARIECDGEEVISGAVTLLSLKRTGKLSYYTLSIEWTRGDWAEMVASNLVSLLDIDYSINLCQSDFVESWEDDTLPVQFFPVHRDDYEAESSSASLGVVITPRAVDEYHPFLNVGDMMRATATQAGYTIESEIMEMDHFKRLYMSGAYEGQVNSLARAAMDFCVKKTSDESTTASSAGRVTISPYYSSYAVANIADIGSLGSDSDCFETNDCLSVVDGVLTFTPTTSVSVGFKYRMRYVSEYEIESRTTLNAFDTFYLGGGELVELSIVNDMVDRRGSTIYTYMEYLFYIFDHEAGTLYKLLVNRSSYSIAMICYMWGTAYCYTSFNFDDEIESLWIEYSTNNGSTWSVFEGDWAMYEGYNDVTGDVEVDVTLRSVPENFTPSSPKSFGYIYVQGGVSGGEFTLLEGTTITPYFSGYPGNGEEVTFEDISRHEERQDTFLESVQHLFNLRFYVDEVASRIYIDPLDEIYGGESVWDWTSRLVDGADVEMEDCAKEVYRTRCWGFQDSDGVTNRMNGFYYTPGENYPASPEAEPEQSDEEAISTEYGAWQRAIDNCASTDGEQSLLNPLFSPSQSMTDGVLIVGDRDDEESVDSLNFTPRIVRWYGMTEEEEPYISFHSTSVPHTLCFEDRDGERGLNQYYAEQIRGEESEQYITLSIAISANELLALFTIVEGMPSLLSRYSFTLYGEAVECRIEAIEEYRLGDEEARIKFLILK